MSEQFMASSQTQKSIFDGFAGYDGKGGYHGRGGHGGN